MSVFVIAGPSSVGKTTVTDCLASDLRADVYSVDELARRSTSSALAFERDGSVWERSPDELCELLIAKGRALWPDIEATLTGCASREHPTVIEGEGPDPRSVARLSSDLEVASVFVVELEAQHVDRTLWRRSSRYRMLAEEQRHNVTGMNVRYGEWLAAQADECDLPWIHSRPWPTLSVRVRTAWTRSPASS